MGFGMGARIMRKSLAVLALSAAVAFTAEAKAATVTLDALAFGTTTPPVVAGQVLETFDSRTTGSLANFTNGALTFSSTGASIQNGSLANQYVAPFFSGGADSTNYLSVLGNTTEQIKVNSGSVGSYFGLYIGSLDTYNSISFYVSNGLIHTFSGTEIASLTGLSASQSPNTTSQDANRYVEFNFGIGSFFDTVVLSSAQNSLELDNVAVTVTQGVPETSTWIMMILGFLSVGLIGYRRRGGPVALRLV
jgi:hypothetical protein